MRVKWQNSTPRLDSTPERRNGNINLSKHFISSSGDRSHNQSVLQSRFVPLHHDWPRFIKKTCISIYFYTQPHVTDIDSRRQRFKYVKAFNLIALLDGHSCKSVLHKKSRAVILNLFLLRHIFNDFKIWRHTKRNYLLQHTA